MSIPASIVGFLREYEALAEDCSSHPWGTVARDPTHPHVHDANRAFVFDDPTPSVAELRDAMRTAQRTHPVGFTQVEVLDVDARPALRDELTAWLGTAEVFVLMSTTVGPPPHLLLAPDRPAVSERPFPRRGEWLELISAGHDDMDALPADVLLELATRDSTVRARAGARFFTAERAGGVVAYASLLSLAGVGLIDNVATVPAHRRRGAATAVVGATIAASVAAGNHQTCLFTRAGSAAQRLYERLGLRSLARSAQFHSDEPQTV